MGFIDFIVRPTWDLVITMLPEVEALKLHLNNNHKQWADLETHYDEELKLNDTMRKTGNNWNTLLREATLVIEDGDK